MMSNTSVGHLGDAELVRYMDGEGTEDDRRRLGAHLERCRSCALELQAFRDRSRVVGEWLDAAYDPARSPRALSAASSTATPWRGRSIPTWWKAAAAITLLAAPLAALPPVREWVADRLPGAAAPAPATVRDVEEGAAASHIRFVPASGVLAVILEAAQPGGALVLGRTDGPEAVLEVAAGGPPPGPVVSARSVRIDNRAGAMGSYRLLLPREVSGVTVRIAGAAVDVTTAELDRGHRVPLDDPAAATAGTAGREP